MSEPPKREKFIKHSFVPFSKHLLSIYFVQSLARCWGHIIASDTVMPRIALILSLQVQWDLNGSPSSSVSTAEFSWEGGGGGSGKPTDQSPPGPKGRINSLDALTGCLWKKWAPGVSLGNSSLPWRPGSLGSCLAVSLLLSGRQFSL